MDERFLWYSTILAPQNLVCNSMSIDWNMGAACYASVAGATSRDPYSLILIGIGSCMLRLCGGSHLQSPNSIEAWELRATPLCGSDLQNPYPCMLALWGRIIVHICLWGVSMVFMRWWPLGPATSMPNMRLFFPGYTWIDIVHDSEGSLIMYYGFVYEALLHDFTNIRSLWLQYLFLWNVYILFLEILLIYR